ncbi:MAG TPA: nucleoside hydrolase [Acidimicrobiia bacterium]|nr:nucleoside hydrolase [Acidimicrobiia bacterium]
MRLWIDTDIGDDPDDTVALWCAARSPDARLVGVSTVDGDVDARAALAAGMLPGVEVNAGPPSAAQLAIVDVLVGIGPWTHVAALGDAGALPRRVVLMGGALGPVQHHGEWHEVEHNVGRDPASAARLLATVGNLIVVPLDATAPLQVSPADEALLVDAIPHLGGQLEAWRLLHGDRTLVLHDPAAVLIALGERISRMESRRLRVERDGTMRASIDGPIQHVVAHIDADATRARVRALASKG